MKYKSIPYRMFVTLLIALAIATVISIPSVSADSKFTDVKEGTVYFEPILALSDAGIVQGYDNGEFKVGASITRAEASVMLANLLNLDTENAPPAPFNDVKQGVWYSGAINSLYEAEIIVGINENTFGTKENITRAALSRMIVQGYDLKLKEEKTLPFTDVVDDAWYINDIKVLYSHGLIAGMTKTTFGPNLPMKRGDFALLSFNTETSYGNLFTEVKSVTVVDATHVRVTFSNNETTTIELSTPLTDGKNTVPFQYEGKDFSVNVTYKKPDTVAPQLILQGTNTYYVEKGNDFTIPKISASDNKDEQINVISVIKNELGEELTKIDTTKVGTYNIHYNAEDLAGNSAEEIVIKVVVADSVVDIEVIDATSISVTFNDGTKETLTLEKGLVHGKNQVSFQNQDSSYIVSINYDALTPAVKVAEEAIAALPVDIKLSDKEVVREARLLVDNALAIDSEATIEGINRLVEAERKIEYYNEGQITLNSTSKVIITNRTYQLLATLTPKVSDISITWSSSNPNIATVDNNGIVTAVSKGTAVITVETEGGKKASSQITVTDKPIVQFNTYAALTSFGFIKNVSTSFYNLSDETLTVENIEVYEDDNVVASYSKKELVDNGISVEINPYRQFRINVSFALGIRAASDNKVKYTLSDNQESFEYISKIE
ncbi:S-layer homology domain-containing protein [Virgibacillus necropolis]|uniref:S-layer homology domain-containing protein n=1 Tax=Virgibacillus necropolis TaxID=163877 RepID=UPI00384CCD95